MNFTIDFFDYTENCKEYQVLAKATSEKATRKELKEGQILFDKITTNCTLISMKINQIRNSIVEREIHVKGGLNEILNADKIVIKYNKIESVDIDPHIEIDPMGEYMDFWRTYEIHEEKIKEHLNPDFSHGEYKENMKKRKDLRNMKYEDKNDRANEFLNGVIFEGDFEQKMPIEDSIKEFLKYYDKISNILIAYFVLFKKLNY